MAQKQLEGCLHADILDKDFKLIDSWDSKLINSWDALCVTETHKKSLLRFVRMRPRDWVGQKISRQPGFYSSNFDYLSISLMLSYLTNAH